MSLKIKVEVMTDANVDGLTDKLMDELPENQIPILHNAKSWPDKNRIKLKILECHLLQILL